MVTFFPRAPMKGSELVKVPQKKRGQVSKAKREKRRRKTISICVMGGGSGVRRTREKSRDPGPKTRRSCSKVS